MSNKKDDRATVKAARINYWGRIIAAVIALIGVFGIYMLQKSKPSITSKEEKTALPTQISSNKNKDDILLKEKKTEESSHSENPKKTSSKTYTKIEKTILYRGKAVKDAYFSIRNCDDCISTKSGIDGKVAISVPMEFIESDKEYEFDVFVGDSLLYSRSMRFSNLNLNKY